METAKNVWKQIGKELSVQSVSAYMTSLGWTIIYYSDGGKNDVLIASIGLAEHAKAVESFVVASGGLKLICVDGRLGRERRLYRLCHELGHIVCEHNLNAVTEADETEAEQFALDLRALSHRRAKARRNAPTIALAVGLCVLAVITVMVTPRPGTGQPDSPAVSVSPSPTAVAVVAPSPSVALSPVPSIADIDLVLITKSGKKYHRPDCIYIEGKDAVSVTKTEAEMMGREPCKFCRP